MKIMHLTNNNIVPAKAITYSNKASLYYNIIVGTGRNTGGHIYPFFLDNKHDKTEDLRSELLLNNDDYAILLRTSIPKR
jgi:hypothetical protein